MSMLVGVSMLVLLLVLVALLVLVVVVVLVVMLMLVHMLVLGLVLVLLIVFMQMLVCMLVVVSVAGNKMVNYQSDGGAQHIQGQVRFLATDICIRQRWKNVQLYDQRVCTFLCCLGKCIFFLQT